MEKKLTSRIAIVLPAYNEAPVIAEVLRGIPRTMDVAGRKGRVTLIVVNDGSRDATAAEASRVKDVILINHIINMGNGAATRTGLRYAKQNGFDYAITMDADGQHDPQDAVKILEKMIYDDIDFAVGSRMIDTAGMPSYKIFGNKLLNIMTWVVLGAYASDTQSGLKALNAKALHQITFHSNSYAFCSEMIWRAKQQKLHFAEVPIKAIYTDYSLSRGQANVSGALKIFRHMLKRRILDFFHE